MQIKNNLRMQMYAKICLRKRGLQLGQPMIKTAGRTFLVSSAYPGQKFASERF